MVVDGQALDEDYTTGMSWPLSVHAPGAQVGYPYTVPDGCVWVMGDNREKLCRLTLLWSRRSL